MENLTHHYEELIKLLLIMSSPVETQLQAHGIGDAEQEMAMDLAFHFNEYSQEMRNKQLINDQQFVAITKIEEHLKQYQEDDDFWFQLESHQGWETIRELAHSALKLMGKETYTLDIHIESKTSWFSKNVATEQIIINVVKP